MGISNPKSRGAPLVITIDGPAGVGKSTAAKLLAKRLSLTYLDTGATYRALAYAALSRKVDLTDADRLRRLAGEIRITMRPSSDGGSRTLLNGRDVTRQIRTEQITDATAVIAQYPRVRAAMVRLQRRLARRQPIVAEGRDTGSVVFPHATYKFFLTAKTSIRTKRRQEELRGVQGRAPSVARIAHKLRQRDRLDRTRRIGPLVRPQRAVLLDTSDLGVDDVVEQLLRHLTKDSGCAQGRNSVSYSLLACESHGITVEPSAHDTRT